MAAGWRKFSNHSPYPEISVNDDHSSVCYGPKSDRQYRIQWLQGKNDDYEQQETIDWVAEIVGEQAPGTLFEIGDWLQNGIIICRLFEELYPGELLRPINEKKSQLSALENITNFLLSAEKSGFLEADLFELSDLQAHKNIPRVIQTLSALRKKMLIGSVPDDESDVEECRDLVEPMPNTLCLKGPPLGIDAKEFVNLHFGKHSNAKNLQFRKGTTTLAFIYEPKTPNDQGGIIVAVDSRASAGEYISSKDVMKILDIGDRMVATMAGGAADCQFWTRIVARYCALFELREKSEITVAAASKYFSNVLYTYRNSGLSVGSMIAGYDKRGPAIFKVDNEGQRIQLRLCSIGSGSLSAYGVLDSFYEPKMTDEEAYKFARRAIMHATFRDSGSGGVCNLVHITPTKKIRFPPIDVSKLYYEFVDEIGRDIVYEAKDDE